MSDGATGVVLTHYIYDPASMAQAVRDFAAFLAITVARRDEQETELRFASADGGRPGEQTVREFLNYLLDLAVRARLSANQ